MQLRRAKLQGQARAFATLPVLWAPPERPASVHGDVFPDDHAQMRLQNIRRDRNLAIRHRDLMVGFSLFVTRGGTLRLETSEWWMIVTILVNLFHGHWLE